MIGTFGMFRSGNEAGTAAALVLAGLLVLVGVQGTPLLQVSKEGGQFARRENFSERVVEEAETRPDVANLMIESFEIADPGSRNDPLVIQAMEKVAASQAYQRRLVPLLREAAGSNAFVRMTGRMDGLGDFAIGNGKKIIAIEPIYAPDRAVRLRDVEQARRRAEKARADAALIITNSPQSIHRDANESMNAVQPLVGIAFWNDDEDAEPISKAVHDLRVRLGSSQAG